MVGMEILFLMKGGFLMFVYHECVDWVNMKQIFGELRENPLREGFRMRIDATQAPAAQFNTMFKRL